MEAKHKTKARVKEYLREDDSSSDAASLSDFEDVAPKM
jgi:hypothetical protein